MRSWRGTAIRRKGRTAIEHLGWPVVGWLLRCKGGPTQVVKDDLQRGICDGLLGEGPKSRGDVPEQVVRDALRTSI